MSSSKDIKKDGTVNVHDLCPAPGDSIMVVNCGTHYEVRYHHWVEPGYTLTDQDVEDLTRGRVTWH
jgi:hypothetical protein